MTNDETNAHRAFALPGAALQYGPDKTVDVEHIHLDLVPDVAARTLEGVCTTTVRALDQPVSSLALDAVDLQVAAVERDGRPLAFVHRNDRLEIAFDPPIPAGERADFAVTYRVSDPRHGLFFVASSAAYPHKVAHAWTQSQDQNARFWFPCLDYPHEKQTTSATIVVPRGMFALSNGALVERRDEDGRTIFTYRQDVPHATYLVTMVVGPFVETLQRSGEKPVYYYVLPGREADGERSFGKTPQMIDVFERLLAFPYPYARYSQIAVGDFIFGGMENTSATTQTDRTLHDERAHLDFSSDPLVAHELAHQWFGDLLTCRDWSHAWLNEGFATFFEAAFREADLGYDEYLYDIFGCVERYLREDKERYRRPIVCNRFRDPIELFDRHLYEKGAAVLHMLRAELGEGRFWRSIQRYVRDNAQRSVETIDLIRAVEAATGRNVRGFFDQWVMREGHPELQVGVTWDAQRRAATIVIEQRQKTGDEHPPHRFDVDLGFAFELPEVPAQNAGAGPLPGEQRVRVHVERARETVTVPLEREPRLVRFDPGASVLADVTYRYGAAFAAASASADPDVVARIRAARELAKDGSRAARDALARLIEHEPFWGVLAEVCGALEGTHSPWARRLLLRALEHAHPKVRRAAAHALGAFKDGEVAAALLVRAREDASYFVQAAALESLGKTRDARAFEVLRAAVNGSSWNATVEAGAAAGLGELADARAVPLLLEAAGEGREETLRRAALTALARVAELLESERTRAVEAIVERLDDGAFLVRLAAIAAAERSQDRRVLDPLDRLSHAAFDGRIRRNATEAAMRVREALRVPSQVTELRSDFNELREAQQKLQEQIEALPRP